MQFCLFYVALSKINHHLLLVHFFFLFFFFTKNHLLFIMKMDNLDEVFEAAAKVCCINWIFFIKQEYKIEKITYYIF